MLRQDMCGARCCGGDWDSKRQRAAEKIRVSKHIDEEFDYIDWFKHERLNEWFQEMMAPFR